ncbi:hypothetical protein [Terrarubrum flagellatum]|uniref:hypothetical protein n=1 Tax=Terrirubrum flagellatum TaxID=2895980 RepID=UPI0031453134
MIGNPMLARNAIPTEAELAIGLSGEDRPIDWSRYDRVDIDAMCWIGAREPALNQPDWDICDEDESPGAWGVFGHLKAGGRDALCDFWTKAEAMRAAAEIERRFIRPVTTPNNRG